MLGGEFVIIVSWFRASARRVGSFVYSGVGVTACCHTSLTGCVPGEFPTQRLVALGGAGVRLRITVRKIEQAARVSRLIATTLVVASCLCAWVLGFLRV